MVFVRWHYRAWGLRVLHLWRRRPRPGPDQTSLLPVLLSGPADDPMPSMRTGSQDVAPPPVLPGQFALPIPAIT